MASLFSDFGSDPAVITNIFIIVGFLTLAGLFAYFGFHLLRSLRALKKS